MADSGQESVSPPLPPGSYGLPFIGETIAWRRDRLEFLRRHHQRYGRIFKSRTYGYREFTMLGPEANEFILSSHRDHFEWQGGHELFFHRKLFRHNIFLMDGDEHARHRASILPAFHGKAIRSYVDVMLERTRIYADRWEKAERITVFPEMRTLTFDIASRLLLGADTGEQTAYLSGLFDALSRGMTAFPRWDLPLTNFGRARRAVEKLRDYLRTAVEKRRHDPGHDVLGMLTAAVDDEGNHLTDEEIVSHLVTLLVAAHDTTTSSLTWLLYELARHPQVKVKLIGELEEFQGDARLSAENVPQLKYLDLVLKEVERLHPAVSGAPRKVVKAFDFDGYRVPAGAIVWYSTIFTHMMPEVFANPESFDPNRFAPPRSEDTRTPFSLIGFGGGPRSCIGRGFARMEMKAVSATLLNAYDWDVLPGQNLRPDYTPTKCPRDGLKVAFEARRSPMDRSQSRARVGE